MAIIKKYGETLTQNLSSFQTYLVDDNPNSTYFKITEFKDSFTGGKNGFLIEGSEHLKETTEIKVQILDVEGNPIYYEPGNGVPEYYEGTSKVVAVYIYEDTPIGTAKITILGELKTYVEEGGVVRDIPDEWKNVYNVKWEKSFQVNRLLANEDKVRFYRRPTVSISEIVKPIFNNVTTTVVQTGSLSGIAQFPQVGTSITNFTPPTTYLLSIEDNTNWTGSIAGTTIRVPSLGYSTLVDSVVNNKDLLVVNPYTQNGLVSNFTDEGYTASFNYVEGVNNLKTALTGSFAKIVLSDLTTFIGDVARVKIFRKSQSDLADYQFIQEIRLESNEILRDLESQTKNEEFYGIFDNSNFKNYWATSSNSITTTFNQNYLYNSVKLDSPNSNYFYTTASLGITENIEYTLNLNVRVGNGQVNANNYIRAFLSGSKVASVNGQQKLVQVEKNIVTVTSDNSLLQKNQITANFKAEESNNNKLYFEVKGNEWYISDISLRASQETAYSPDEITFIQSVPRTLPEETFLYDFEFYDVNNNYIPVLVQASKTFNGGNLQRIQKGLVFTPRSLQFQFDSGSQPVPPTVVGFTVTKNLLTGSVTYTSQSFDFDGNELFGDNYTSSITLGGGYPGLLDDITSDAPTMTVQHFTGSRTDKTVQLIKITGEVEGFTDTVIFSRVLDGFGGVNHLIRPYRGTQIKNSSTQSLEIQAIRIDGVNDIEISSLTKPEKGWPDKQLHVLSASLNPATEPEKFINLALASSSRFIKGLTSGSLGSGEINYNATFNRDSIDTRRTIYLMSSQSAASGPAYITSASVLASIILEDLQDGLDTPVITYNTDTFNIDPRTETLFRPTFAIATASFYKRGTAEPITASFRVFPSMSINRDWTPEYWLYYTTQSVDPTITVTAIDEARRTIAAGALNSVFRSPLQQSKNLTVKFTYTEPYNSPSSATASISIDKTFTIVPQGTPGDETIIFEVNPATITLAANSRGIVNDYKPSITDIRIKQGARYLAFSSSAASDPFRSHGQFYIASSSIIEQNVKAGNIHFTSSFGTPYTASLIVSQSSNFTNLSGSITYPLVIHPYFTSSIYTASVVVNYTKVLDGAPPIQIVVSPTSVAIPADEVGFVSNYNSANTSITVKEGDDFLLYNTSSLPGTWKINSIETRQGNNWNIRTGSLVTGSASSSFGTFNRFDFPYVSASATYTIQVYPFALGSGHQYTSSIFTRTQTFTKNVSVPSARTVELKANPYTINYDRDGYKVAPEGDVELKATAFNTTGSAWFTLFFVDTDGSETLYDGPYFEGSTEYTFIVPGTDAAGPEENKTWRVKLSDGNPYTSSILNPYRAEGQLTIAGIKAGADAYKIAADNLNTSITAELFNTNLDGTAIKLPTFKGIDQLINVTSSTYPAPQPTDYDYLYNLIGILGYSSASIYYKSPWIGLQGQIPGAPHLNRVLTRPASMPNITYWDKPAINKSGEIVYKIEFEGYSSNLPNSPRTRHTEFVTQSIAVQFTEPAPYDVKMQNENSSAVYRVSGEIELGATSNIIRAYRGGYELTNKPAGFVNAEIDAYGSSSYEYQCEVEIVSYPADYITLDNGNLIVGSQLSGNPATMPGVTAWDNPEINPTAEIVYGINCEGRQTIYKTQSLSVQFEGAVGPGIVMRGEWSSAIDYIGQVETTNNRRDAVTYLATPDTVKYYAAISGSGPNTYDQNNVLVNYHAPTPNGTNAWWEYLGDEEFFVAAKIAIFEESYVKNTINVGTKNGTGAFANIVIAGGRTDPYIAIGQNATVGTSGNSGTSLNPGGAVIGYERPGIFLGIYEQPIGSGGTTGRLSIVNGAGDRYLKWDGSALEIAGNIRIKNVATARDGGKVGAFDNGDSHNAGDVGGWELASDAIYSGTKNTSGYNPGAGITLAAAGSIHSKNFYIDTTGNAFFKGTLSAAGGSFAGDISAATGTFGGTVSVGTGEAQITLGAGELKGPGFLLNSTGLTVSNASISGVINAEGGRIGSWYVDADTKNLRDVNNKIFLNPNLPGIEIKEGSDTKLKINFGSLTDLSGTALSLPGLNVSAAQDPLSNGIVDLFAEGTGTLVSLVGGTYVDTSVTWTAPGYVISAFNGYGDIEVEYGIRVYVNSTSELVNEFIITSGYWGGGFDETFLYLGGYAGSYSFVAPVAGSTTYRFHAFYRAYGQKASGVVVFEFPSTTTPVIDAAPNVDVVELTNSGIQIASSAARYLKLPRPAGNPLIEGKGYISLYNDTVNPTIKLLAPSPSGTTAGGIDFGTSAGALTMNNNNITLNGGGSTTAGIIHVNFGTSYVMRLGGQSNESIIISNAWPNQATNVATARLRPNTKLGMSGRELIFDSSTIRVKKDVEDYPENAYEIIKNIKPVLYWPRARRDSDELEEYNSEYVGKLGGFIAEWLDAEPELRRYVAYETTEENPMDPSAIAYDKMVVPLTKAVQMLMAKVEKLEAIISGSNN